MQSEKVLTNLSGAQIIRVPLGTSACTYACDRVTLWCLCGAVATSLATAHIPCLVRTPYATINFLIDTMLYLRDWL